MKSYLLDTSAYSNLVRGDKAIADIVRSADELYVSIVTIAELHYGFECGTRTNENKMLLIKFLNSKKVRTIIPDHSTVGNFSTAGKKMKEVGHVLSHHDLWLVAQAIQHHLTLVSYDKDFTFVHKAKIKDFKLEYIKL